MFCLVLISFLSKTRSLFLFNFFHLTLIYICIVMDDEQSKIWFIWCLFNDEYIYDDVDGEERRSIINYNYYFIFICIHGVFKFRNKIRLENEVYYMFTESKIKRTKYTLLLLLFVFFHMNDYIHIWFISIIDFQLISIIPIVVLYFFFYFNFHIINVRFWKVIFFSYYFNHKTISILI